MVAVAIAKMDQAALRIAMHVDATPGEQLPIVLPYQDWHQILNDLAGARAALRTQQVLERRQNR
jgi:hypothetical protein